MSILWIDIHKRQWDLLEYCQKIMRNLESRLSSLDFPLEYFNLESLACGYELPKSSQLKSAELKNIEKTNEKYIEFKWSQERYDIKQSKKGMMDIETKIAYGAAIVWGLLIVYYLFNI